MDDDPTWCADDLTHATRLYGRVRETGESVDDAWERNGYRWRLIARSGSLPDGRPDAYLTAHGGRSAWRFSWIEGAWQSASHIEHDR